MTAHENHAQLFIAQLLFQIGVVGHGVGRVGDIGDCLRFLVRGEATAADGIDGGIMRNAKKPRRGILRYALVGPGLERPQHGFLHSLLGQVEIRRAEQTRQVRDHAARLPPEEVFQQNPGIGRRAHDP